MFNRLKFFIFVLGVSNLPASQQIDTKILPGKTAPGHNATPMRTLVLLEESTLYTHFRFLSYARDLGHVTTEYVPSQKPTILFHNDQRVFENILMLVPSSARFSSKADDSVSSAGLVRFIDDGGNVMVVTGAQLGKTISVGPMIRQLANECGIEFDPPGYIVSDPLNSFPLPNTEFAVLVDDVIAADVIVSQPQTPLIYRGVSHAIDNSNSLILPILRGKLSSVSALANSTISSSNFMSTGRDVHLVSAMQANNNARVTFIGSVDLLSDAFFDFEKSNAKFAKELMNWNFGNTGILDWANLKHHKIGELASPWLYSVKDEIQICVDLFELRNANASWVNYRTEKLQVELTMLDPYIIDYLEPNENLDSPSHCAKMKLPDKYGVFKFIINVRELGYNYITLESLAPIRNLKHDDYPRFLSRAIPYYTAWVLVLLSSAAFGLVALYDKEKSPQIIKKNE